MSTYYQDLGKEDILAQYLDASIYPLLSTRLNVKFERVRDKRQQQDGIDVIAEYAGKSLNIDEKSQLDYINNPIPTCAFEIAYLKNGELREGWLYDKKKVTDRYFYITHIRSRRNDDTICIPEDITGCKILSINRDALINALAKKGVNREACIGLSDADNVSRRIEIPDLKDIYLIRSVQKAEGPLNLVIQRKAILSMLPRGAKLLWDE